MEGKDGTSKDDTPDVSTLILSATLLPFPPLVDQSPADQNALLIRIIENLEQSLPVISANVRATATAAFVPQQVEPIAERNPLPATELDREQIAAQNEEMMSWISMPAPAPAAATHGIKPGQPYDLRNGSKGEGPNGAAANISLRVPQSRIDGIVRKYREHSQNTLKYYYNAYERRMGKPWSTKLARETNIKSAMHRVTTSEQEPNRVRAAKEMSEVQAAMRRASTIASESSVDMTLAKGHVSDAAPNTTSPRKRKLDMLIEAHEQDRPDSRLSKDPRQNTADKDEHKRLRLDPGEQRTQNDMLEHARESDRSHATSSNAVTNTSTVTSEPSNDTRKPPGDSLSSADKPALPKLKTDLPSKTTSAPPSAASQSAKATTDPRRRRESSALTPSTTVSASAVTQTAQLSENEATSTDGIHPTSLNVDKARDPRRRPQ